MPAAKENVMAAVEIDPADIAGLSLAQMAVKVLSTADGRQKTALGRACARAWFAARDTGTPLPIGTATPPDRPARPA